MSLSENIKELKSLFRPLNLKKNYWSMKLETTGTAIAWVSGRGPSSNEHFISNIILKKTTTTNPTNQTKKLEETRVPWRSG